MSNPLLTLAKVAADWRQRALSDDIEWSTRRAVLDWFATTLPGCLLSPGCCQTNANSSQFGVD